MIDSATAEAPTAPAPATPPQATPPDGTPPQHARPAWERPALALLLLVTAGLYLWGLGAGGWANSFYSAAAQAGSRSWKALFFGSSDAANSITIDKPPAAIWPSALAVRLFGLNSWSILVPQALMGVATVGCVYASVRRWFSAPAALLGGAIMATTPVAALMFRFNNPDALLTLLMVLSAYATLRGIESGARRWVIAAGAALGWAFLAKQLQMMLVVPALGGGYLLAAPHRFTRRLADAAIGLGAMVVSAGWWITIVTLWPAESRPYIGGSQHNSILELTLGYNGFGRLTGNETGSVGGPRLPAGLEGATPGGQPGSMWGQTGITRLFDGVNGGQIAWLIPAALVGMLAGLWITRRAPRTGIERASLVVWGGWLVVTGLVFSFMAGIFHEYYSVALAPAIAALVGIGADLLWSRRAHIIARLTMALTIAGSAVWASVLLHRAPRWNTWLTPTVLVLGALSAVALLLIGHRSARLAPAIWVTGGLALILGPTAWTIETIANPQTGSIVTAGPPVQWGRGQGMPGFPGEPGGGGTGPIGGFPRGGAMPDMPPGGMPMPGGLPPGAQVPGMPVPGVSRTGGARPGNGGFPNNGGFPTGTGTPSRGGGMGAGGLLDSADVSDAVRDTLLADAGDYTWVAAAVGSQRASGFQLASEQPVMAIGGFNGSDPSPTLERFQQLVRSKAIHYFIGGAGFGNPSGGSNTSSQIAEWVTNNFESETVDGVVLYDLTQT